MLISEFFDSGKWELHQRTFPGGFRSTTNGDWITEEGFGIAEGLAKLKQNPEHWQGLTYQTNLQQVATEHQSYTLFGRESGIEPWNEDSGDQTFISIELSTKGSFGSMSNISENNPRKISSAF